MAILLAGGLRIQEALDLKISDYFIDEHGFPYLLLTDTKNGDTLEHPIGKWAEKYLMSQIAMRRDDGARMTDTIFAKYLSNGRCTRKHLSTSTAQRSIKRILIQHGLPNCSCHSFRKTLADKLVLNEVHVEKVRQALRHSDIRITQDYFSRFEAKNSAVNIISWM